MRAWQIRDAWSFDNLRLDDIPEPQAGPGEVKVRLRAASINFRDLLVPLRGYGALTGALPLIPLSDGAGEVVAIGPGVTRVRQGDRVCPLLLPELARRPPDLERCSQPLGGPVDGVWRICVFARGRRRRIPSHLSFEEAATLPCAALTAWSALVTEGSSRPATPCSSRAPAASPCSPCSSPR